MLEPMRFLSRLSPWGSQSAGSTLNWSRGTPRPTTVCAHRRTPGQFRVIRSTAVPARFFFFCFFFGRVFFSVSIGKANLSSKCFKASPSKFNEDVKAPLQSLTPHFSFNGLFFFFFHLYVLPLSFAMQIQVCKQSMDVQSNLGFRP